MDRALQRHVDRDEIVQLAWTYGKMIDTNNVDGWIDLFVDDVKFTYQGGIKTLNGRDELLEFFIGGLAWSDNGPITHVMSNVVVEFDDDDPDQRGGVRQASVPAHHDRPDLDARSSLRRRVRSPPRGLEVRAAQPQRRLGVPDPGAPHRGGRPTVGG